MIRILFILFCGLTFSQGHNATELQDAYSGAIATVISLDGEYALTADKRGQVYLSIYDGFEFSKVGVVNDIRDEVASFGELGLTGIVLDPDFITNFQYYIYYSVDREQLFSDGLSLPTIGRVTRYTLDLNNFESYDRTVLLGSTLANGVPVTDNNHFGGTLMFGSDGTLLLTTGETGVGSTAQAVIDGIMREAERTRFRALLLNGANGKVLRFDKNTGLGIPSNPFYDSENPDTPISKLWGMGLRNPFRAYNDISTGSTNPEDANVGTIYIGDVGAGNWEEITVFDKQAQNGGWKIYESFDFLSQSQQINLDTGNTFHDEYIEPNSFEDSDDLDIRIQTHKYPSIAYSHPSDEDKILTPSFVNGVMTPIENTDYVFEGLSVIMGVKVQGEGFGADLQGDILFSDVFSNTLVSAKNGDFTNLETVIDSDELTNVVHYTQNLSTGNVYATTLGGKLVKVFYDETLSNNEFVFDYGLAEEIAHYDINGKKLPHLNNVSDGVYITLYKYQNRYQSKKRMVKNGKILSR